MTQWLGKEGIRTILAVVVGAIFMFSGDKETGKVILLTAIGLFGAGTIPAVQSKLTRRAVPVLLIPLLFACGLAPHETVEANDIQLKAAEAIEADYQDLAVASTNEIAEKGKIILQAEVERRVAAAGADAGGFVPVAQVSELIQFAVTETGKIESARQSKLDKLRASVNMDILRRVNASLRKYLAGKHDADSELDRLFGEASVKLKGKP
jgi:hypothetical protein